MHVCMYIIHNHMLHYYILYLYLLQYIMYIIECYRRTYLCMQCIYICTFVYCSHDYIHVYKIYTCMHVRMRIICLYMKVVSVLSMYASICITNVHNNTQVYKDKYPRSPAIFSIRLSAAVQRTFSNYKIIFCIKSIYDI